MILPHVKYIIIVHKELNGLKHCERIFKRSSHLMQLSDFKSKNEVLIFLFIAFKIYIINTYFSKAFFCFFVKDFKNEASEFSSSINRLPLHSTGLTCFFKAKPSSNICCTKEF